MSKNLNEARDLLNSLNLGTQKAKLGDLFVSLVERVEELEKKVADLEGPVEE